MTNTKNPPPAKTNITREEFMDFFRANEGWTQLSSDDRAEIFLDVLYGSSDVTADMLNRLIDRYGIQDLEVKCSVHPILYVLTMEDALHILRELGHKPTPTQLDQMESRIRKGVEWGLGDCWHDVMRTACEIAWDELRD